MERGIIRATHSGREACIFREENLTKIMLVDNDENITDLLQKLLKADGFDTVATNDSRKAVKLAVAELPDLFLLDLMMPQPDGFRLTRMLREEPALSLTPIIIVTALDDSDSRAVAFGAGATDYITKPFHPGELKDKIIEALES
jgi:two-component system alkaline phosphatase synthesis response regulator PhoP